jgi:hypothetical protein
MAMNPQSILVAVHLTWVQWVDIQARRLENPATVVPPPKEVDFDRGEMKVGNCLIVSHIWR